MGGITIKENICFLDKACCCLVYCMKGIHLGVYFEADKVLIHGHVCLYFFHVSKKVKNNVEQKDPRKAASSSFGVMITLIVLSCSSMMHDASLLMEEVAACTVGRE